MRLLVLMTFSFKLFAGQFDDVMPSSPEEIFSLTTDLLVDGFVSVNSGQISITETDLIVKGAQDLSLKRIYVPPSILGRYHDKNKVDRLILIKELQQLVTKGWIVYPHLLAGYNRHSKYFQVRDPQGFVLEFQILGNRGILKMPSYGCSNLRGERPSSSADIRNIEFLVEGDWVKIIWPEGIIRYYLKVSFSRYRLEKEVLPNGKMIRYEYNRHELCKITSSDPTGRLTYASIVKMGNNHYVGSDGRSVSFTNENRQIKGEYKKKGFETREVAYFPILTKASNCTYVNMMGYNEKTLLDSYDTQKYPISCAYFLDKNEPARIKTFSNPSGSFYFSYDSAVPGQKEGSTTVLNPNGSKTIYRFNKILLLDSIENWLENKLINKKNFSYDEKQHIKSIKTVDGAGRLLIVKRFECDNAGNPLLEITEGDFGVVNIKRKFNKNRLSFEEYDNGLQYVFTYLNDTQLITSKTTLESGSQLRKTIYSYDESNNLVQIEEEGKTKIFYTLYQTCPHLHRIQSEKKEDWDGNLIYKVDYEYDRWGNISKEIHFDSNSDLSYIIERIYNEKGELIKETNPLNQAAFYKYDARGRCVYEEPISNGLVIHRSFDNKGRLTLLEENDRKTQFNYNASDQITEKIDDLGLITRYFYHPVHRKPYRIQEGEFRTEIEYDLFGHPIKTIDSMNGITIKKFNSYGKVIEILYPEGGQESFDYYPNGLLKSHKDGDGLISSYTYDVLNRIKQKVIGTGTTSFEYDAYNLLKITDAEGFVTTYRYNLTDQKMEEIRENRITRYGYDALGFLSWEQKGKYRTSYTHDVLGRILSKSFNGVMESFWYYDSGGNVSMIRQGETTSFFYDPYNRLIKKIDGEQNNTTISYSKGYECLIEKILDPDGIETRNIYNSRHQLLNRFIQDQSIFLLEYDSVFRLKKQDSFDFGYSLNGNKEWMKEAGGRTTRWRYTKGNRLLAKEKPDGKTILYQYNDRFLPEKIGSREFKYDQLGRLIGGTGFSRTLDPFGNILKEEWSNGLWIATDYDELDRPIIRKLSDLSQIKYEYDGPFLKKVSRFLPNGQLLYFHMYDDYDDRGNPRIEQGLFQTKYKYDKNGKRISQENPYFLEDIKYSAGGNLIKKGDTVYTYDFLSQMTAESGKFNAEYDNRFNLKKINDHFIEVDSLNQIKDLKYDLNGNLLKPGFVYDEFDQLVEVEEQKISYDALGRKIQQGATAFLYVGDEEIGSWEQGQFKELKILGNQTPIAIEINRKPYVPIIDVQGIIRYLVDGNTKKIYQENNCDAFGVGLSEEIPYAYTGKRYDSKTGLVYFGKRYYDPSLRRWLTPDPIGALNHSNLYQYLFNNPYVYQDKNGEFAFAVPLLIWGAEVALPTISAYLTAMTYTAAAGVIAYAGYKYAEILKDQNRGAQNYNDYVLYSEVEEEEKPNQPGPRTEPKDLSEQLALEEAKAKPQNEQDEIMKGLIKDPRYPCNEWKKVDHVHEKPDGSKIDIHYWEHRLSGQKQEFKFKNPY